MKDKQSIKKDIIKGTKISREGIYYTALFTLGAIVAAILVFVGMTKENKGLTIYASVLLPIFIISALVAARFVCISVGTVCKKGDVLVIKTFFTTRKYKVSEISKLTVAQNNTDGITTVNITRFGKNTCHKFKDFTKEEVAHLKRATIKK